MGAVDTTYTFTATDTITSSKMNNIIDQTTITGDAIFGTTLEVVSGKLKVRSQNITSNELATDAVTSTKIAAGAVTSGKLSTGGPQWGADATNLGLGVSGTYYFQLSPIRSGDGSVVINLGAAAGNNSNASITRLSGVNGQLWINQTGIGPIVFDTPNSSTYFMSPNGFSLYKDASNTSNFPVPAGTAPIYGARAWVNFDGTTSPPTVRSSGNVASVAKTAAGNYIVTLTTAIANSNYAVIATSGSNLNQTNTSTTDNAFVYEDGAARTSNSFRIRVKQDDGGVTEDRQFVSVVVFG